MKFQWLDVPDFVPASTCNVAAAIIGAGALSAGASMYGASAAADAQGEAAANSIAAQREMFGEMKGLALPYINAGRDMLPSLQGWSDTSTGSSSPLAQLLRLTSPGADMSAALAETPGFKFSNEYGQKAVQNALAARGLGGPGGALAKGAAGYAEGLAGNTWNNVVSQLLNTYNAGGGQMQNVANMGSNALASLSGNSTQVGSNIGSNMIGAGNAQAGAYTAMGNAVGNFGNSISTAAILQQLTGGGGGGGGGLYGSSPGNVGGTGGNLGGYY